MTKLFSAFKKSYTLTEGDNNGFFDVAPSVYFSEEVQSLSGYEQHLQINRLQHITSVSYLTYVICKKYGLDTYSGVRAAIMHDLFYYDWRDGENGKWHSLHGYKHPKYAAVNAKALCPDLSKKETDIIKRHMFPLTIMIPNSPEGLVVSLCDKYCATVELLYSKLPSFKAKLSDVIGS